MVPKVTSAEVQVGWMTSSLKGNVVRGQRSEITGVCTVYTVVIGYLP